MSLSHSFPVVAAALVIAFGGCEKKVVEQTKGAGKQFELSMNRKPNASLLERANKPESPYDPLTSDAEEVGPYGAAQKGGVVALGALGGGIEAVRGKSRTSLTNNAISSPTFDTRLLEVETVDKRYKEHFDRAQKLLESKQFDQALVEFDEAKLIDPNNYLAYFGESSCYFHRKDYAKSLAAIDFAIARSPNTMLLYNNRAQIRAIAGESRGAIDDISRLIEADPRDATSLSFRAQLQGQLGNLQAAAADYTAALKERPGELMWLYQRGWVYFNSGRFQESAADAGKILELQPGIPEAYFLRSASRYRVNDFTRAKSDFDEAIRLGLNEQMAGQLRPAFYPAAGAGTR